MRGWWRGSGCGRLGRRLLGRRSGLGEVVGRRWTSSGSGGGGLQDWRVGFDAGAVRLFVVVLSMGSVRGGERRV